MTIERRIERLEKIHPTKSMSEIDEWLIESAEPYENDEERKEILKVLEKLGQDSQTLKLMKKPIVDIPMNMYPKLYYGLLVENQEPGEDQATENR